MASEKQLVSPPTDGISAVRFTDATHLVSSSWDGSVRLHDVVANTIQGSYAHKAGVLDVAAAGPGTVFSGGVDLAVRMHDFVANAGSVLGSHEKAVRCVEHSAVHNVVITGSWDASVRVWDARVGGGEAGSQVARIGVPDRVYSMTQACADTLVVATASRHVLIYDVRKMAAGEGGGAAGAAGSGASSALLYARESNLKNQTRVVRAFTDGSGFATGSIEGRVAVDFIDPAPHVQAAKFAFKCHRIKLGGGEERVFPVHALAFHPVYGTFATGGGDGTVAIWDWTQKKRITALRDYGTSISSLAFSPDGALLAIAASYCMDQGDVPHPPDAIHVRTLPEAEVRPKNLLAKTDGA